MSTTEKVKNILNSIIAATGTNDLEIVVGGATLYTHDQVLHMLESWYDYIFVYPELSPPSTIYNPVLYFIARWKDFVSQNGAGLKNEYDIFNTSGYDPISNYDVTEGSADGKKLDKKKETTTPTGEATTQTDLSKTGINSGTPSLTDRNTTTVSYNQAKTETETTHDNTQSMTYDGSTKTGYNETNEHYMFRRGNIGVTTTQQMAESEIQLRKHDLLYEFCTRFINRYCFYAG